MFKHGMSYNTLCEATFVWTFGSSCSKRCHIKHYVKLHLLSYELFRVIFDDERWRRDLCASQNVSPCANTIRIMLVVCICVETSTWELAKMQCLNAKNEHYMVSMMGMWEWVFFVIHHILMLGKYYEVHMCPFSLDFNNYAYRWHC